MEITNLEKQFLFKVVIFLILWTMAIQSFAVQISTLAPIIQFLITSVLGALIFGIAMGHFSDLEGKFLTKKAIGFGTGYLAFDLVWPPFIVDLAGAININVLLAQATIDAQMYYLWSMTGLQGFLLWVLVYPVSCILLLLLSALLLSNKDLISILK